MNNPKNPLTLLSTGITFGIVIAAFLFLVLDARPSGVNIGPVEIEFPTPSSLESFTPSNNTESSPSIDSCPSWYGEGFTSGSQRFKANTIITGPAALHPFESGYELGEVIGFEDIPHWGINIPSGQTVTIPSSITLRNGQVYSPVGNYETYATYNDIIIVQQRWLQYCQ